MPLRFPWSSSQKFLYSARRKKNATKYFQDKLKDDKSAKSNSSLKDNSWTRIFIIASYLSAILIASVHLFLVKFLDGKIADGPDEKAPQTYVNTASQFLANAFQICLQASLSTSFVQSLGTSLQGEIKDARRFLSSIAFPFLNAVFWLSLRHSTLKVSTIESLFLVRSDPLSFKWHALTAAPQLICLAVLIWATYAASIFPPGALTVGMAKRVSNSLMPVPTFDPSYIGDGSFADANKYSLDVLSVYIMENTSYIAASSFEGLYEPFLQHLANRVVVNGEFSVIPTPCGANCSYTTTFDGPYFLCNTSFANTSSINNLVAIYNGTYDANTATFYTTSWSPTAMSDESLIATQQNLTCLSYKARYILDNEYQNSVQSLKVSAVALQPLASSLFELFSRNYGVVQNLTENPSNALDSITTVNWTTTGLERYRDINLMNIIDVVRKALAGTYNAASAVNMTQIDLTIPGYGDTLWSLNNAWTNDVGVLLDVDSSSDMSTPSQLPGPNSGTYIAESKLNDQIRLQVTPNKALDFPVITFTINQDLLNEILMNVTLSIITAYGLWNTTANVTVESFVSTYRFSSPINLIIPYFLSLAISLPFIFLGLWSLKSNGFPAAEGGFLQLITTTRGASLERDSATGSLGTTVSPEIKNLKIRFGELKARYGENQGVRRAGFGTEDETLPLERGVRYGRPSSPNSKTGWV